jgi:hypothetical protein
MIKHMSKKIKLFIKMKMRDVCLISWGGPSAVLMGLRLKALIW